MGSLGKLLEWIALLLAALVAGGAATFFAARRRIVRQVQSELGTTSLLLAAGARVGGFNGYARRGEAPTPGVLMLLATGLYFHSWIGRREVFIPGASISWIGVSETREPARKREKPHIVVRFLNASGKEDGIVIRLLYPEQWVEAIKTHLITRG